MKAISVKCPNCGASMNVAATVSTASCAYCGTTSRIRARTRILEVPAPMSGINDPAIASLPVAVQRHSGRWFGGLVMTMVVAGSALAFALVASKGGALGTSQLHWASYAPLLADVNGDGTTDAIGRARYVGSKDEITLAAFDGASGAKLWETEPLGSYTDTYQGTVARVGEAVMFASGLGVVRFYSIDAGEQLHETSIGERLERACASGSAAWLRTADERWLKLEMPDGVPAGIPSEVEWPEECQPVATDGKLGRGRLPSGTTELVTWGAREGQPPPRNIEGIRITSHAVTPERDWIGLGHKQPGTRVPMAARYRFADGEIAVAWITEVPAGDPLAADEGAPEELAVAAGADCVVIAYEMQSQPLRVACLSLESGARRWDVALPKAFIDNLDGVAAAGDRGFVTILGRLHILDLASGRLLHTIGRRD